MVTNTDKSLSQIFDVMPTKMNGTIIEAKIAPVINTQTPVAKLDDDFELARLMMHSLMIKGANSLDTALLIANGTEDPKAFDAVSKLISNLTDVSERLISLHEKRHKSTTPVASVQSENSTNILGPVFVGSTSELALMINNARKDK